MFEYVTNPSHLHWNHHSFKIALDLMVVFFFFLPESILIESLNVEISNAFLWIIKVVLIRPAAFFSPGHSHAQHVAKKL